VSLNATTIASGRALGAQVTIFNKLDENLSLTPSYAANPAIHSWAEYDYFCGGGNQMAMVGYALFQGYYSQENSSLAGKPMQLAPFVELPCATWPDPTSIVFLPHNDTAKVYGTGGGGIVEPISVPATTESCSTNGGTTNCGAGTGLFGYWNTSAPLNFQQAAVGSPFFRYLPLGEYTLAVQDVWNQTVYAHFQVVPLTRLECPSGQTAGSGFGTVTVSSSSPAIICVEVYYYSFSAITLNLTDALQVQAVQSNRTFSGDSNFIITPSQSQLVIGASSNVNEGTLVAFAVTARAGASGTYELGLLPSQSGALNTYMFGVQEPEDCGYYGLLVAGDGQPNYAQATGGCFTYNTSSAGLITVPGIPYGLESGDLDFRIVGVTNSTR
jgi:hypothetical protein